MTRRAATVVALLGAGLVPAPGASAAVREFWVGATPTTWNAVPNQRDGITGAPHGPSQTVFPTVTYRRYGPGWRKLRRNTPHSANQDRIPGPLLRVREGDVLRIHFKNLDTQFGRDHSMHFHGAHYRVGSDGAYIPGVSGPGARVAPGKTFTYVLDARRGTAGVWPYHDHSTSMHESIEGGMWGMLSIRRRSEPLPDKEFVVVFAPMGEYQTIDGRAFVGNTPVFKARLGELVQWDVMAMGSEHHTFHVHGHRWRDRGRAIDTRTLGPAESFRVRWREDARGTWLYHCHVESHMEAGMIGTYRVTR